MRTMTGHTDRQASPIHLKFGSLNQKAAKFCNLRTMTGHTDRQASPIRLKFGSLLIKKRHNFGISFPDIFLDLVNH
jgi:hypothetical protein